MNCYFCNGATPIIKGLFVNMLIGRDKRDSHMLEQYVKRLKRYIIKQMITFLFGKNTIVRSNFETCSKNDRFCSNNFITFYSFNMHELTPHCSTYEFEATRSK